MTIEIEERNTPFQFGDNVLFVNFNYTDTLCKRFGVNPVNEFHIHGSAQDKESILVGHATHPEYPYEPLCQIYELLDEIIKPYVEDPYHHMKRDSQIRLEAAAVRRRFWSEQQERNEKMEKEYLRMLKKKFHVANFSPYINLFEEKPATSSAGAKWHISYFSEKDKKRMEEVMKNYGCGSYTLYPQIDQCIEKLDLKNVTSA